MDAPNDVTLGFNAAYYKGRYSDLMHMSDSEALQHFVTYGHREGRQSSNVAGREVLIPQIPPDHPALEIGPFGAPQISGPYARYADYLSTDELRKRAPDHGFEAERCPEIHYVLRDVELGAIPERFWSVFSSHCIEHQPDLIKHLHDVATIMEPGGRFFLVVPDKRYCFDHFVPESNLADVFLAPAEKRRLHSLRSILISQSMLTHNDPTRHWNGDHGEMPIAESGQAALDAAVAQYTRSMETGEYIDVHAWQFTPQSFHAICSSLFALGFTTLKPVAIGATMWGRTEFCAILQKSPRP
jgi:SAM-dependent methyltransferase